MEDTKEINGRNTDTYCRDRIADIASGLCPVQDNESRMAYANLILEWVMWGDTTIDRYARTQTVERAYQNRIKDTVGMDRAMTWPELRFELNTLLRFIGGES
jgi:hypothetical protein